MYKIAIGITSQDWKKVDFYANALQESSTCVGAGRIFYACYYIQNAYKDANFEDMIKNYPLLVEEVIEFKRYARKMMADDNY